MKKEITVILGNSKTGKSISFAIKEGQKIEFGNIDGINFIEVKKAKK